MEGCEGAYTPAHAGQFVGTGDRASGRVGRFGLRHRNPGTNRAGGTRTGRLPRTGQQRPARLRHRHHRAKSRRSPATTDSLAAVRQQGDRTGGPHHQVSHLEKVYRQGAGLGGRIANRLPGRYSGHEQARGDLRRGAHAPGGDPGRQQGFVGLPARNGRFGAQVATAARTLHPARTLPAPPHPGGGALHLLQAAERGCHPGGNRHLKREGYPDSALFPYGQGIPPQAGGCGSQPTASATDRPAVDRSPIR